MHCVERILVERLRARHVVIGADFRFGKGRAGDVDLLGRLGEEYYFAVDIVPAVLCDGERISSSGIRKMLGAGDFDGAERWLEVTRMAHGHGLRSNATMLYGHIETTDERVDHLICLREQQDCRGGFLAFMSLAL